MYDAFITSRMCIMYYISIIVKRLGWRTAGKYCRISDDVADTGGTHWKRALKQMYSSAKDLHEEGW